MALNQIVLTTQSTPTLVQLVRKYNRGNAFVVCTILVYGTFGSGTVALYLSPDGGTTLIPLTSSPGGTAITFTANGMVLLNLGNPHHNTDIFGIWAEITGGTSSSVTVNCYDNNG